MPHPAEIKLYLHYPAVAAVVSVESQGRRNALACVWHTALSFDPPLYAVSVSPKRFSHGLLSTADYFAVNFLPFEKADLIARFGRNSGRDLDKFATWQVETFQAEGLSVPVLADAYAAYICRKVEQHTYGDHDLFVGQILWAHAAEQAFDASHTLRVDAVSPALYLGNNLYSTLTSNAPRREEGKA